MKSEMLRAEVIAGRFEDQSTVTNFKICAVTIGHVEHRHCDVEIGLYFEQLEI